MLPYACKTKIPLAAQTAEGQLQKLRDEQRAAAVEAAGLRRDAAAVQHASEQAAAAAARLAATQELLEAQATAAAAATAASQVRCRPYAGAWTPAPLRLCLAPVCFLPSVHLPVLASCGCISAPLAGRLFDSLHFQKASDVANRGMEHEVYASVHMLDV